MLLAGLLLLEVTFFIRIVFRLTLGIVLFLIVFCDASILIYSLFFACILNYELKLFFMTLVILVIFTLGYPELSIVY